MTMGFCAPGEGSALQEVCLLAGGVFLLGVCIKAYPPEIWSTNGRCISYWNAFLLKISKILKLVTSIWIKSTIVNVNLHWNWFNFHYFSFISMRSYPFMPVLSFVCITGKLDQVVRLHVCASEKPEWKIWLEVWVNSGLCWGYKQFIYCTVDHSVHFKH